MLDTLRKYALKRIEFLKIEAVEKVSSAAGTVIYFVITLIAFVFFTVLFNFGVAFLIGKELNNYAYGFLIVAGFYLLIVILTLIIKRWIINYVANNVIPFLNK